MNSLRPLLLAAMLFFAQWVAGAHAAEHGVGNDGNVSPHVCELCLATHDLASALPSLPSLPSPGVTCPLLAARVLIGRSVFPAPSASQRAPPLA